LPFFLEIFITLLLATVLGLAILRRLMRRSPPVKRCGPWGIDLSLGSAAASMYMRAYVARHSIFALRAPETVYFSTGFDSSGQRMQAGSCYRIRGRDLDTRWWSLTAYQRDYLIPNALNRYSFSKTTISMDAGGNWEIRLGPRRQPGNWLPSGEPAGNVTLVLRCYGPGPELLTHPENVVLPEIVPEACS
jgi:hypothetical protein